MRGDPTAQVGDTIMLRCGPRAGAKAVVIEREDRNGDVYYWIGQDRLWNYKVVSLVERATPPRT